MATKLAKPLEKQAPTIYSRSRKLVDGKAGGGNLDNGLSTIYNDNATLYAELFYAIELFSP
jgi:hypothetical protein